MISLGNRVSRRTWSSIRSLHSGSIEESRQEEVLLDRQGYCGNWPLYKRIKSLGSQEGMVSALLDRYTKQARIPSRYLLHSYIRLLRKSRLYHLAIEIMEWMETRGFGKDYKYCPTYLDLLGKDKGVDEARKFFDGLSPKNKNIGTYGALLNLYCKEKMEDEACALFTEMEEKNVVTSLSFSCLISLCLRLGKPEKISPLVEIMKRRNLKPSTFMYNIWMTSYLHLDDVEGAERVFREIKEENKCDWTTYSNLAVIYVKSNLRAKAELALKELEQEMGPPNRDAYHYLLTLYASTSNLEEVHRIWRSLKSEFKSVNNKSCSIMLQALGKLDDMVGLKQCYEEWESSCYIYDNRIARIVIEHYLRHHMLTDAQMVFRHVIEVSTPPYFDIFEIFMKYYLSKNQVEQALCCLNFAASQVEESGWKLNFEMTDDFLTNFEETGNVESAEEFCKLLKKLNCLESFVYSSLLKTYIAAGKTAADLRERIENDRVVVDADLRHLLDKVCPE